MRKLIINGIVSGALLLMPLFVVAANDEEPAGDEVAAEVTAEVTAEAEARQEMLASINELVAQLQTMTIDLNLLRQREFPEGGAAELMLRVELAERRHQFRLGLARLGLALAEVGDASPEHGRWFQNTLLADALLLKAEIIAQNQYVLDYLDVIGADDAAARQRAQSRLRFELPEFDRLLEDYYSNIELRDSVSLNTQEDQEVLGDALIIRGHMLAGALRLTHMSLDMLGDQSGKEADPASVAEITAVKNLESIFAASTRVTITLMDGLELNSNELREALILLTGSAGEDVLNIEVMRRLLTMAVDDVSAWIKSAGPGYLVSILFFFLIIFLARILSGFAQRLMRTALDRSPVSTSNLLRDFFINMTGRVVVFLGVLIAIAQLGIQIGPLLAGLGIAGFVIGFALQDVLSNFASGMMILVYRPFDVGDFVEAGGVTGKVSDMTLVSTKILTLDNQLLFVPNNKIWGDVIRNVTHQDERRVDLVFGIGYSDDIDKAERILVSIVDEHKLVLDDPEPAIKPHELGDSSVNFVVRPWVKTEDYWDVYWDITREVKRRFDAEGISIPFPQRDVHLYYETPPVNDSHMKVVGTGPGKSAGHTKVSGVTEEKILDREDASDSDD
jgi:small conductance mechanosensitive channel